MLKLIRSLYHFYLNHFFIGICISLSCCWVYDTLGNAAAAILSWYKIITMVIFYYAVNQRKGKEFFYYQNLGISKRLLWTVTLSIDFMCYLLLMYLTQKK